MPKNNQDKQAKKQVLPHRCMEYKIEVLPEVDTTGKVSNKLFKNKCILTCDHSGIERIPSNFIY